MDRIEGQRPVPRASQCMTYDEELKAIIIYGGYINDAGSKEFWELKNGPGKTSLTITGL